MAYPRWASVACGLLSLASLLSIASLLTITNAESAGDYFVHSLPGTPEGDLIKMHAGHIEINPDHNGNLFFWHFENQHIANRQRTVIWLNGGPGCSSEDGVMMEIGPYRLKDENTLEYNNGSWHEFANLLFVDNPVGTGYSYVDTNSYVHELDEMADQFVAFLEKWFVLFPQYEHDDIYIAGESYAGQHIPYITRAILDRNKDAAPETKWNVKGLLIGNGWISPNEQYEAYLSFAYEKDIVKKGSDVANQLEAQYRICSKDLATHGSSVDVTACEAILQEMLRLTQTMNSDGQAECINMYDVRLKDVYPSCGMNWPPDLKDVTPYLRRPEVVAALHVDPNKVTGWQECNGAVGAAFRAKRSKPAIELLPDILTEVDILLFSGAEDLICNHLGTESFISNMEWNGGKGFETSPGNWAPRRDWTFEGEQAGFWQSARNLTYVLFYNSSHMVPFDYARRTRDMLDRFMNVNITSIGGTPSESLLDGEKLPDTTVGGATNNTDGQDKDKELQEAKWAAYQKSGEIVLAIVAVGAAVWGFYIWRARRRTSGYTGLPIVNSNGESSSRGGVTGLEGFRNKRTNRDVEAGDFDEGELDDLHVTSPRDMDRDHYSIGGESDADSDSEVVREKPKNGQSSSRSS
ncbi:putative carboxypeptidase kex1 protein [Eutypa lata UCREL1]|uniref:Carboxypeptidase n=1 Tax=Eutypa lata (strain UCR-EL1) TaxID=1287681 RepID=M7SKP8_EUTLA|nr:putative carboxypeptidase kex1 protein [Eutypa lata UCREL1]